MSESAGGTTRGRVSVVTDSTARIPPGDARRHRIQVVPLHVVMGSLVGSEDADVTTEDVARAMAAKRKVTTSRPSPATFAKTYRELQESGAAHIVSVHIGTALSGTCDAARAAAESVSIPVEVVDSGSVGAVVGTAALAAARVGRNGRPAAAVRAAQIVCAESETLFAVDTLEYLWRGGRIGSAQALLGTALGLRPVLCVRDGVIAPVDRPRATRASAASSRGRAQLVEHALLAYDQIRAQGAVPAVTVSHVDASSLADQVATAFHTARADVGDIAKVDAGAVIACHVGPGTVGLTITPQT